MCCVSQRSYVPTSTQPPATPGHFLETVVRPVYELIVAETFEHAADGRPVPRQPTDAGARSFARNYDDWNERFWTLTSLFELRTRGERLVVMAAPPEARYPLLLEADWAAFFATTPKSFRELRWWYCLFAANRRIFMCHVLVFLLCFMAALPRNGRWDFNGWRSACVIPFVTLVPSVCRALGMSFEWWAVRSWDARRRAIASYTYLAVVSAAAAVNIYAMVRRSPQQVDLRVYAASLSVACTGGTVLIAAEMRPQRPAAGTSLDDNLCFERRTAALAHQPWFVTRSSWRLRHEVISVLQLYLFWLIVWALKVALAVRFLLPAFFDA